MGRKLETERVILIAISLREVEKLRRCSANWSVARIDWITGKCRTYRTLISVWKSKFLNQKLIQICRKMIDRSFLLQFHINFWFKNSDCHTEITYFICHHRKIEKQKHQISNSKLYASHRIIQLFQPTYNRDETAKIVKSILTGEGIRSQRTMAPAPPSSAPMTTAPSSTGPSSSQPISGNQPEYQGSQLRQQLSGGQPQTSQAHLPMYSHHQQPQYSHQQPMNPQHHSPMSKELCKKVFRKIIF